MRDLMRLIAVPMMIWPGTSSHSAPARESSAPFRDCPACPEMISVSAGTFWMGSDSTEQIWAAAHGSTRNSVSDESPRHSVTLRAFAIGRYQVTRGEFAVFAKATGFKPNDGCGHDGAKWLKLADLAWDHPGYAQTDRDPVVCVSWHDAKTYIAWLNKQAGGNSYRLPTEAEWEYATRAGSTTMFWWGNDDSAAATHAWFKDNADAHTHPVGQKPVNGFGLFDAVGNVWQWTEDCYASSYANAATDGSAHETCSADDRRVDRGGSWLHPAWLLRSAPRERNPSDYRDTELRFRVAKTLP